MRTGRVLLIAGAVIAAIAIVALLYIKFRPPAPQPTPIPPEETPVALPQVTQIVVSAQNIPRGMKITAESNAVAMQAWSGETPEGAIQDLDAVYNRITRVDIARGMPILGNMLAESPGDLAAIGSDTALQIPVGRVAYALPVARYSSIAWALQPGDHVDVILSVLVVDLDEEFQTTLPNQASCISPPEGEGCSGGLVGREEVWPGGLVVNITPVEGQHPRLVTQVTVQDAIVLQIGDWPEPGAPAPAEVQPTPAPAEGEQAAPPPTPSPDRVEPLTLAVTRQDAAVLDYAQAVGARINFVLRPAGDTQFAVTESVTLQYLMDRFAITLPPKLPYGVTPPVYRLEPIPRTEVPAQYGVPPSAAAQ